LSSKSESLEGSDATPLQLACHHNLRGLTRKFCETGADVDVRGGPYGSALSAASYLGHDAIVRLLLEKGADINVDDPRKPGRTPLSLAIESKNIKIVELLLEHGANINSKIVDGNDLLWRSVLGQPDDSILKLLLKHGLNTSRKLSRGRTALLYLLMEQPRWDSCSHRKAPQEKMVNMLIDWMQPMDLNAGDETGNSALAYGIMENLLPRYTDHDFLVKDQITSVLQGPLSPKSTIISVVCQASWEILEYFRLEFPDRKDLNSIFTLTGDNRRAQGITCGEYVRQCWPRTGSRLLEAFEGAIQKRECSKIRFYLSNING
jgi:hypothetical protein